MLWYLKKKTKFPNGKFEDAYIAEVLAPIGTISL